MPLAAGGGAGTGPPRMLASSKLKGSTGMSANMSLGASAAGAASALGVSSSGIAQ